MSVVATSLQDRLAEATAMVDSDPVGAEQLLQSVMETAHASHEAAWEGRAAYVAARVAVDRGQLDVALSRIERASTCLRAAGLELEALRTQLGRMHVLDDRGRHADAVEVGTALLDELDRLAAMETDPAASTSALWLRAAATENIGTSNGLLGRHLDSLEHYQEAARIYGELGTPEDEVRPTINSGVALLRLGRCAEAIERFTVAREEFLRQGSHLRAAQADGLLGEALVLVGRVVEGFDHLHRADRSLADHPDQTERIRLLIRLGAAQLAEGLLTEAAHVLQEAAAQCSRAGLVHDLGLARVQLAWATQDVDPDAAIGHAHAAGSLLAEAGDAGGHVAALLAQSSLLAVTDGGPSSDWREPLERAEDVLTRAHLAGTALPLEAALLALTRDVRQGDVPSAALRHAVDDLCLPGLRRQVAVADAVAATRAGDRSQAARHWASVLQHEQSEGRVPLALRAAPEVETERRAAPERGLAMGLRHDTPTDEVRDVWATMDGARSRRLARRLDAAIAGSPSADVELSALYEALLRSTTDASGEALRARAVAIEGARSRSTSSRPPSSAADVVPGGHARAARDRLTSIAVPVLDFLVVDGDVVTLASDGQGRCVSVAGPSRREVDAQIRVVEEGVRRARLLARAGSRRTDRLWEPIRVALSRLDAILLQPVRDRLGATPARWVVVDGPFRHVPFDALVHDDEFLFRRTRTVHVPSVGVGATMAPTRSRLVAVGVSDDVAPMASEEASAVARRHGADLFTDEDASTAAVREAAASARSLHLACHGLERDDNPLFSSLRMGDRWVTAAELAGWDLHGALVVLSSCEAARASSGRGHVGAEVGIAAALHHAGARHVVSSRWVVDDLVAARHLPSFTVAAHAAAESDAPLVGLLRALDDLRERVIATPEAPPLAWAGFCLSTRDLEGIGP